ncbi:hypothetical protein RB195_025827 [Necator americanus]|uniref:Uncharacterized protein n=1 Tax=Necator americanus TaxID=51031 RepID=A0ABR1EU90_NECAM
MHIQSHKHISSIITQTCYYQDPTPSIPGPGLRHIQGRTRPPDGNCGGADVPPLAIHESHAIAHTAHVQQKLISMHEPYIEYDIFKRLRERIFENFHSMCSKTGLILLNDSVIAGTVTIIY